MTNARSRIGLAIAVVGLVAGGGGQAKADLTLTPAGVAQGLSLTTFTSGFPNSGIGPLGTAFANDGAVLVSDYNTGNIYRFPTDTDGQVASSGLITANYGGNNPNDMAQLGSNIYMTRQATGDLIQLNQNGTFNQNIVGGMPAATGMAADPFTGHLFVSTLGNNTIWEVDPSTHSKTAFINISADGLSLSPDGSTLYAAGSNGHLLGINTTTKAVFDFGFINTLDGTAAGTGPVFGNYIFANTNDGRLIEINLTTLVQTLIANNGSRGDFVTVDPTNDTLLITQTDRIIRLNGATFTTPEPSTFVIAGTVTLMGLGYSWRRRKRSAV